MNVYSTRYFDHEKSVSSTHRLDGAPRVTRDYDFAKGDERRINQDEAYAVAKERAAVSGKVQQVRRVDGPLLGQKLSLIQETGVDVQRLARTVEGPFVTVGERVTSWPHQAVQHGTVVEITDDGFAMVHWDQSDETYESPSIRRAEDQSPAPKRYPVGTEIVAPKWLPWVGSNDLVIRRRLADGTWLVLFDNEDPSRVGKTDCNPESAYKGRPFTDDHATLVLETYGATLLPTA